MRTSERLKNPVYREYMRKYLHEYWLRNRDVGKLSTYRKEWGRRKRKTDPTVLARMHKKNMERYHKNPLKVLARQALYRAVKKGTIIRPRRCQICHKIPKRCLDKRSPIQAHHDNYNLPLVVVWACTKCHGKLSRKLK